MDFNDLRVLFIAMFAFTFVVMLTYAQTGTSTLHDTEPRQSANLTEQTFDPLNPRSSPNDDSITTRLPLSEDNDLLHDDDSPNDLRNDYTSEFDDEQFFRKEFRKREIQHSKNKWAQRGEDDPGKDELQQCGLTYDKECCDEYPEVADCNCRCGLGKSDVEEGTYACPAGSGAFGTRPTLYKGGNIEDGPGGAGGSESSSAARIAGYLMSLLSTTYSMGFLAGLIPFMLLFLAF